MKKEKRKIKEVLWETVCELLLALLFFGIGALILRAFGISRNNAAIDPELTVLIGFVAVAIPFLTAWFLVAWIKKRLKAPRK